MGLYFEDIEASCSGLNKYNFDMFHVFSLYSRSRIFVTLCREIDAERTKSISNILSVHF